MLVFVCTRDEPARAAPARQPVLDARSPLAGGGGRRVRRARRARAGTRGRGAFLSVENAGATWEGVELPEADVFSVAIGAADGALYAGTEPSRLFVARDGGAWAELEALQDIPSRSRWSFPPRPWTHHVRWMTNRTALSGCWWGSTSAASCTPTTAARRSRTTSRGQAGRPQPGLAPAPEDRAYQAAGDGAASTRRRAHLEPARTPAASSATAWRSAVDPADPRRWYVSAASGPRAAHGGGAARAAGSTAGTGAGKRWRCRPARCPTRWQPPGASCSPGWRTAASCEATTAAELGRDGRARRLDHRDGDGRRGDDPRRAGVTGAAAVLQRRAAASSRASASRAAPTTFVASSRLRLGCIGSASAVRAASSATGRSPSR